MILVLIILAILTVCFGGVLLFGAPYLPTLSPQVSAALELADLQPGQTLLELGSGDGKVLIAAAKSGIHAVGYELNPLLAALSWLRTWRYRQLVTVVWGDFWRKPWPQSEAVFVFLLDRYMHKLDTKLTALPNKPIKLISFAFRVPDRKAIQEKRGVYLYLYE